MIGLHHDRKRGVAFIWVVLMVLTLMAMIGLATDAGLLVLTAQQLQIGADAGALSGARHVRDDIAQARADAAAIALENRAGGLPIHIDLNEGNAETGDIVVGRYNRISRVFTPQLTSINAIRVTARRTPGSPNGSLPLVFGPMFGRPTANVQRSAIAMVSGGTGGLILLNPHDPKTLYVRGGADLAVNGGDVFVNSDHPDAAVDLQGSSFSLLAPTLNIVGGISSGGGDLGDTLINTGASPMPAQLNFPGPPAYDTSADKGEIKISTGQRRITPGYYSGGATINGGRVTFDPGIYFLGGTQSGGGLRITGGNVQGDGVMFFIAGGGVEISGNGIIRFTPPNPELYNYPGVDTYSGILFYQPYANTSPSLINGTPGLDLQGTLFFPTAHVALSGNSDSIGSQYIANTIEVAGDAKLTINYNGAFRDLLGSGVYLVR